MIIRNGKDTMLISTAGADPYSWRVSPNGHDLGLPFIFTFQRGLFYLQKLSSDKSTKVLFNATHRDYFLNYYNTNPNFISKADDSRIPYLKVNKHIFQVNDTLSITVTGRVLNDGGCDGGSIFWTLQKLDGSKWKIEKDNCCTQMDCGSGPTIATNLTLPLLLLKDKINKELVTYPQQREIQKGIYRIVIYDDYFQPYWTNEFIIE